MKTIKKQMVVAILLLVLIPLMISMGVGYYLLSTGFQDYIKRDNREYVNHIADNVKNFIDKAYSVTEDVAYNSDVISFEPERQEKILKNTIQRNSYFDLLFIQGTDGMQTARSSGDLGNRANRWWFIKVMNDKKPFVTKSYYSRSGNIPVTSIIMPIYDEGKNLVGIMGSDIKLDALQRMIEKASEGMNKYAYVVDGEGVVVAHPVKKQVDEMYNYKTLEKTVLVKDDKGRVVIDDKGNQKTEVQKIQVPEELKEAIEKALAGESDIVEYIDENGEKVISAYTSISLPGESDKWAVITVEPKAKAMGLVTGLGKNFIITLIVLLIIISVATFLIANNLMSPLVGLKETFFRAADGDLTVQAQVKSDNEIGELGTSFNLMLRNIGKLIKEVKGSAYTLSNATSRLKEIISQTSTATNEVATAIEDIAKSAGDQARDTEFGAEKVNDLSDSIEDVSQAIEIMNEVFVETNQLSNRGLDIVQSLIQKSKETANAANDVNDIVMSVDQSSEKIGVMTESIEQIAEQTNLLALNAAIEAARAGEHGRGFAVVAEEVRKLAEQSAKAANEIKELIGEIQRESKIAVRAMNKSNDIVREQDEAVKQTEGIFNEISSTIKVLMEQVEDIKRYNDIMTNKKNDLIDVISNISAVAEETSASTQQVSASTEEQLAAIEEVNNYSYELNELAQNLLKIVEKFHILGEMSHEINNEVVENKEISSDQE